MSRKLFTMVISVVFILFTPALISASSISFSGGHTSVSLQEGNRRIELSGGASVSTDNIEITSDLIELYGDDYNYVRCTGNVNIKETSRDISLACPSLLYDRTSELLISDGWVEIEDLSHNAKLSAARFEYNTKTSVMKLQMRARMEMDTDNGILTCTADSIEYNADEQTATVKGFANIVWGDNSYKASMIIVNIETEEITLYGSISGEVNG